MKIVVLDGYAANPGDLSWDRLNKLGEVFIYDRTPKEEIIGRAAGSEAILINKTPITRDVINNLPQLKYIGVLATGYNVVDTDAAREKNIVVTNIPDYSTYSVSQMVFALLLELCHHVQDHSNAVHSGKWSECRDFCFWDYPLIELAGKTMGIIGFGSIGKKTADIAQAMGMKILAYSRTMSDQSQRQNFQWAGLEELLEKSDVVSLHCPLTNETRGMINKERLARMKSSAFLINTARGPLIVEEDLAEALNRGTIAGAGVDVLSNEPPKKDNPLLAAKNCIITPHIAWATKEARVRLMDIAISNLEQFVKGNPINVVNR